MTTDDSPIIDFYPSSFEIDMNGKKMAWQGVALLPFIDEKRLLDAMALDYPRLSEEENKRNRWGSNVIFASDEHPIYPFYERLYGKRKTRDVCPLSFNVLTILCFVCSRRLLILTLAMVLVVLCCLIPIVSPDPRTTARYLGKSCRILGTIAHYRCCTYSRSSSDHIDRSYYRVPGSLLVN